MIVMQIEKYMQNIVALVFEEKMEMWISNMKKWYFFATWTCYNSRKRVCSLCGKLLIYKYTIYLVAKYSVDSNTTLPSLMDPSDML